ncbi:MAG: DUF202 domain-containing protein [Gemmatimonadaceae bacterium]|nr:DUF202 domain-containing protein [Gemmatimonadaceae bacterium]
MSDHIAGERAGASAERAEDAPPHPPHTTEHLSNERTFLAWVRTSIAIIGLGFVMARFSVWLEQLLADLAPGAKVPRAGASLPAGVALICLGGLVAALAVWRYHVVATAIERGEYVPPRGLLMLVAVAVIAVCVAVVAYLVATTTAR